jgi:hypothetical protein
MTVPFRGGKFACATCHPRGDYPASEPTSAQERAAGAAQSLWGARGARPYSWAEEGAQGHIRGIIVDRMKGKEPTAAQVDQLAARASLDLPERQPERRRHSPARRRRRRARGSPSSEASCNICHAPPVFWADAGDIGSGGAFSVPRSGALGTAPYFRWPVRDAASAAPAKLSSSRRLGVTDALTNDEIEDLLAFLSTL